MTLLPQTGGRDPLKTMIFLLFAAAVDLAAGVSFWRWVGCVKEVRPDFSRLLTGTSSFPLWPSLAVAFLFFLLQVKRGLARKTAETMWPLLPASFLPLTFPGLLLFLGLAGWSVFRFFSAPSNGEKRIPFVPPERSFPAGVLLLAAGVFCWHWLLQCHACEALYLQFQDWGEYLTVYEALTSAPFSFSRFLGCAGHFNPAVNAVMALLVFLHPAPETLFAVTAALLTLAPVLAWKLAKSAGASSWAALGAALVAAWHPVLLNQSLALGYGYHPSLFQIPLIFGFWIFREKRERNGMIAMIVLSLLVQETAAFLWFGAGLCFWLAEKRRKQDAVLAVGSLLWFLFLSSFVMPRIFGTAGNPQLFHYHRLGNTFTEILFSPFLRPSAFFSILGQKQNLIYVSTLFIPTLFFVRKPKEYLMILPMLAGILMQESAAVKNIMLHNALEITLMLIAAGIAGIPEMKADRRRGSWAATIFLVSAGAFFWGRFPCIGKISGEEILKLETRENALNVLKEIVPEGAVVHSNARWRWTIRKQGRKAASLSSFSPGEWVLLEINNPFENCEALRRRLLASGSFRPATFFNINGCHILLMQMTAPGSFPQSLPCLRAISFERFLTAGEEVPLENSPFRLRRLSSAQGTLLRFYLTRKTDSDYDILLSLSGAVNRRYCFVYGDGFVPAFSVPPGTVYELFLPQIPEGCRISCEFRPR